MYNTHETTMCLMFSWSREHSWIRYEKKIYIAYLIFFFPKGECKGRQDTINENTSFIIYPQLFELKLPPWWQRVREEDAMLFLCMCPAQLTASMAAPLGTTTGSLKCWGQTVKDNMKGHMFLLIRRFAHWCSSFELKIYPDSYKCDCRKKCQQQNWLKKQYLKKGILQSTYWGLSLKTLVSYRSSSKQTNAC